MTTLYFARIPFLLLLLAFGLYFAWLHIVKTR